MPVDAEFVEMMYNGYPKGWIAIFDNALPLIPRLDSWQATAYVRAFERARRPSSKSQYEESEVNLIHVAAFRIRKAHPEDHGGLGQIV